MAIDSRILQGVEMSKIGKLFVFEGPDGVGKTILAERFTDHLKSKGITCNYLSFPGREVGTLGRHVYDLHHNPAAFSIESITPASLQVLHIAAHLDAIERQILPALRNGHWLVLDRYWWSTWVYGVVSGASRRSLGAMINLEVLHWGQVLPTVVLLICRTAPLRDDESPDKWHKLCATYHELADKERYKYPVRRVENDHSITESLNQILNIVDQLEQDSVSSDLPAQYARTRHPQSSEAASVTQQHLNFSRSSREGDFKAGSQIIFTRLSPAKPTEVFDTYWRFASERQAIFFRKFKRLSPPWTDDPIFARHKFTNAYRASDRVSQYLIKNVIYCGEQSPEEMFFRTILFKIFNRIGTWELLQREVGVIQYSDYSFERYDDVLNRARSVGERIYSAAYIMPSGGSAFGYSQKHRNHLKMLEMMMEDEVPSRICEMRSMREIFELLRSYPMIGDFLAYQYVTDLNYSELINFSEMEFVVPGPGALDGIRKCFHDLGGLSESDIIRLMAERQEEEFARLNLEFQSLWGRPLQLIDCQNLFCEVGKYARIAHPEIKGISSRTRIKQNYRANSELIEYWYPPKWKLNDLVEATRRGQDARF